MGKGAKIKLEDKDTDVMFRECPIETYPGLAIQSVTDSSRFPLLHSMEVISFNLVMSTGILSSKLPRGVKVCSSVSDLKTEQIVLTFKQRSMITSKAYW